MLTFKDYVKNIKNRYFKVEIRLEECYDETYESTWIMSEWRGW